MGQIKQPRPAVLFSAISSFDEQLIDWARSELAVAWGEIRFCSPVFDFDQTSYYREQMGDDLLKQFIAFEKLIDPAEIVRAKMVSNELEARCADENTRAEISRPVNIDPGYVTEAKLVLATTKDRDHRIYLAQGILAEVTLYYQNHQWNASRWTYPDYKTEECFAFLDQCRHFLRNLIHSPTGITQDNVQRRL